MRTVFDKWYDSVEGQIDRGMDVVEKILWYAVIAGSILLVIVQGLKVSGLWLLVFG